ncbi:LysR substrate-binding domain-containing protein [Microbacterium album]|uniref:Transcriptional regulator n=1 Tax=Microbacterium album TaxID=2053191 RepID=A0A917IF79_9MICO|nr:LysR substrate-binding domain-containing protein [Microbacterium album]GGH47062.1 transcriptional regulator [Microbacterium album]
MGREWNAHRLRLLRELQLRGTVTAVAAALNYSSSTVSQQLARLEEEVGVALTEADGRRVRLTSLGEVVAAHAGRVLALEEETRGLLDAAAPSPGTLRIAAMQTAALALIPAALSRLSEWRPDLRVEVALLPPERGLFEVEAHAFDLVIAEQYPGRSRPHPAGLQRALLGSDPISLVVAEHSTVGSLGEARDAAWVMEPEGTAARSWAVEQCRAAGFEPDVRYEAADLVAHLRLIASGHAVGFVPGLAMGGEAQPVRRIDPVPAPSREVFVSFRRASSAVPVNVVARQALAEAFRELRGP